MMTGFLAFVIIITIWIGLLFATPLKGYRTKIAAGLAGVGGGLLPLLAEAFAPLNSFNWMQYTDPRIAPWIMLAVGIVFAMLRHATNTPAGKK